MQPKFVSSGTGRGDILTCFVAIFTCMSFVSSFQVCSNIMAMMLHLVSMLSGLDSCFLQSDNHCSLGILQLGCHVKISFLTRKKLSLSYRNLSNVYSTNTIPCAHTLHCCLGLAVMSGQP